MYFFLPLDTDPQTPLNPDPMWIRIPNPALNFDVIFLILNFFAISFANPVACVFCCLTLY
jgi:hypothetical protein